LTYFIRVAAGVADPRGRVV